MTDNKIKRIEGGVTYPQGFQASGIHCGLRKNKTKKDLALILADKKCNTAAIYTTNKVFGAPITVTREHLKDGLAQAVICNSGNANTCNPDGVEKANAMCKALAEQLHIAENDVVVASTGVIGMPLPLEPIINGIPALCNSLGRLPEDGYAAAAAIMTTDTRLKQIAAETTISGVKVKIGGMAKGSGMIHPNMATTLNFITTDCAVSAPMLQKALSEIVKITYNCLSVDGDQSTNDTCMLMSNGLAENAEIAAEGAEFDTFKAALYQVMANLTRMLAKDGEGATKLLTCICSSAPDLDTAIIVAKSVIRSPLFKCAMFGADANWGRVLCAIGYAEADFDINRVDVDLGSRAGRIAVCRNGAGVDFSEDEAKKILTEDEIEIYIELNAGNAKATAWGCDLTYDYVKINGDYRS